MQRWRYTTTSLVLIVKTDLGYHLATQARGLCMGEALTSKHHPDARISIARRAAPHQSLLQKWKSGTVSNGKPGRAKVEAGEKYKYNSSARYLMSATPRSSVPP